MRAGQVCAGRLFRRHDFPPFAPEPWMTRPSPADIMPLVTVMARLRDPDTGCPWDIAQDFASIAPYTIEEAYEVMDAIERRDMEALRDELGDLLFCCVNLTRKLGIDPETALRGGNAKFERRFRRMEALMAADGLGFNNMPVDDVLEKYWARAKGEE